MKKIIGSFIVGLALVANVYAMEITETTDNRAFSLESGESLLISNENVPGDIQGKIISFCAENGYSYISGTKAIDTVTIQEYNETDAGCFLALYVELGENIPLSDIAICQKEQTHWILTNSNADTVEVPISFFNF